MGNNFVGQMVVVLTGIIGVAIVATLVSKNAQTPQVISSFGKAMSGMLNAATAPVTGGSGGGAGFSMPQFNMGGLFGSQF